jgi:hypothetical protein
MSQNELDPRNRSDENPDTGSDSHHFRTDDTWTAWFRISDAISRLVQTPAVRTSASDRTKSTILSTPSPTRPTSDSLPNRRRLTRMISCSHVSTCMHTCSTRLMRSALLQLLAIESEHMHAAHQVSHWTTFNFPSSTRTEMQRRFIDVVVNGESRE